MAGYSGTPLAKKLGITAASSVKVIGDGPAATLADAGIAARGEAPFDVVLSFVQRRTELADGIHPWSAQLTPAGGLWVCWPKKTARRRPEFSAADMTEDDVRAAALPLGLVDNKVCAVDDHWSALRVVWRLEHRAAVADAARLGR